MSYAYGTFSSGKPHYKGSAAKRGAVAALWSVGKTDTQDVTAAQGIWQIQFLVSLGPWVLTRDAPLMNTTKNKTEEVQTDLRVKSTGVLSVQNLVKQPGHERRHGAGIMGYHQLRGARHP